MPSPLTSLLPLSSRFVTEHDIMQCGTSFSSAWIVCPSSFPSHFLVHPPKLLTGGAEWRAEKASMLCEHHLAVPKTSVCCPHCPLHKSRTPPHKLGWLKSQPKPIQKLIVAVFASKKIHQWALQPSVLCLDLCGTSPVPECCKIHSAVLHGAIK